MCQSLTNSYPHSATPPWEGSALHPVVANMPADVEVSIESVARYIAQQEPDPLPARQSITRLCQWDRIFGA